MLHVEYVQFM